MIVAALVAAGCSGRPEPAAPETAATPAPASRTIAAQSAPSIGPVPATPVRIEIPAIDLDEPLIGLGLTETGAMQVPSDYDDVGWFLGGGRPGGFGPTVLAGHVDSTTGPAVFDRLTELEVGDLVMVSSGASVTVEYRIEAVQDYAKNEFPTAEVFGAVPTDELRLITCSGDFDAAVGTYERNFVAFGVAV